MEADEFLSRAQRASNWWVVRGERGKLWPTLFWPSGVVAHGRLVPKFPIDAGLDVRERSLQAIESFARDEVNTFHDTMEIDDVVLTPEDGGREGWFGIVTSDPFADERCSHWIQRRCDWLGGKLVLTRQAAAVIPKTPAGTIFNMSRHRAELRACIPSS